MDYAAKASALVHVDGEVATDAVAVALFRTDAPWAALRSHWYAPTCETMRITKVLDESAKRALEIDGKPAAARYAELLGVEIDDLEFGKPKGFVVSPTALKVGKEYFLRAPWKPLEDGSIVFANLLEEGSELELVKITGYRREHAELLREGAAGARAVAAGLVAVSLLGAEDLRAPGKQADRASCPTRSRRAPLPVRRVQRPVRDLLRLPHQLDVDDADVRGRRHDR